MLLTGSTNGINNFRLWRWALGALRPVAHRRNISTSTGPEYLTATGLAIRLLHKLTNHTSLANAQDASDNPLLALEPFPPFVKHTVCTMLMQQSHSGF